MEIRYRHATEMAFCVAAFALSAAAQSTPVTTPTTPGGITNTLPLFTGIYTLGNSVITQSNGNIGIGTTSPTEELDIEGKAPVINVGHGGAYEYDGETMIVASTALFNYFLADYGEVISPASTGYQNLGVGYRDLNSLTTGYGNAAFGNMSMIRNTTGFHNTALGYAALEVNTTGNSNTGVGEGALWKHVTGNSNTAVGLDSMFSDTGSSADTVLGQDALYSNTLSNYNTSVGHQSMFANTTGSLNTALGEQALYLNTTGRYNTAVGYLAGSPLLIGNGNTTGNNNSYFGASSGPGSSSIQYSYQTDIGAGSVGNCNNCVVLGRVSDAVTIPGSLGIGTISPEYRLDVAGTIRSSAGGIVFPDGTIQKTAFIPAGSGSKTIPRAIDNMGIGVSDSAVALNDHPRGDQPAEIFHTDNSGRGIRVGTSDYVFGGAAGTFISIGMVSGTGITTGSIQVQSDSTSEDLALEPNGGNVGIGTTVPGAALEVNGDVKLTRGSGGSIAFQDGSVQSTAYTGATHGGDYAESVNVTGDRTMYEPGDILVIDPDAPGKFLKADEPYSTLVAGIFSTNPGTIGRRQAAAKGLDEVPMALVGIAPIKASAENGPIRIGDLLVASSTLGRAMKGTDRGRMLGAVIGKALGSLDSGMGVIEVLVTLQ